jgi:hypothetical protein
LLFVSIILTGLLYAARMTRRKGSKAEYDWDEYSSELEDDEYEYEDEDELVHVEATAAAATASTAATSTNTDSEETDWVRGSDGYWWYHDKAANEWWYKDSEGNIVRHD